MNRKQNFSGLSLCLGGISLIFCGLSANFLEKTYTGTPSGMVAATPFDAMGDWHFIVIAIGVLMLITGLIGGWVKLF